MEKPFQQARNFLTSHMRSRRAARSLALPPRTERFTRIFADALVESRGRVPMIDSEHAAYWAPKPFDSEHIAAALRVAEKEVAYFEGGKVQYDGVQIRLEEAGRSDTMSQKRHAARLAEEREDRNVLRGLEQAAQYFPTREFVTQSPLAGQNGLLGAAILAYQNHQGLVLAPEAVLATVLQAVARFIFEGDSAKIPDKDRTELEAQVFATGPFNSTSSATVAEELALQLVAKDAFAARLNSGLDSLRRVPGYAPLTDITLLAAFDARYRYICGLYACGVRRIEIEGVPEEWLRIRAMSLAYAAMPELEPLRPWLTTVGEVTRRIAVFVPSEATSQEFLAQFVKHRTQCCAPSKISGWVTNFFPYYNGNLRTEFPVEGGPEFTVRDRDLGLEDHLLAKARVRMVPQPPCPGEPFDVQLVAGLDVREEPCGDMHIYRPVSFHGLWAPLRQ